MHGYAADPLCIQTKLLDWVVALQNTSIHVEEEACFSRTSLVAEKLSFCLTKLITTGRRSGLTKTCWSRGQVEEAVQAPQQHYALFLLMFFLFLIKFAFFASGNGKRAEKIINFLSVAFIFQLTGSTQWGWWRPGIARTWVASVSRPIRVKTFLDTMSKRSSGSKSKYST